MNELRVIEVRNKRVLTTSQLADGYEADPQVIINNYNRNRERYAEGIHYIKLDGEELREFKTTNQIDLPLKINTLYLWTEKGALLHAKSLNTDKAWEVYSELVDFYFRAKEPDTRNLSPQTQMFGQMYQVMVSMELKQNQLFEQNKQLSLEQSKVKETIQNIKETLTKRETEWRAEINKMIKKIAYTGKLDYQQIWDESYRLLEARGRCSLNIRVENLKQRLKVSGETGTKVNSINALDVIEKDARLKEIYTAIVKEMTIKYVA